MENTWNLTSRGTTKQPLVSLKQTQPLLLQLMEVSGFSVLTHTLGNVQLTPFRFLAVPPPMSAAVLNVNLADKEVHYVNEVFFGPHQGLGVVTSSRKLAIYKNSFGDAETKTLLETRSRESVGKRTPPPDFSVPPTLVGQVDLR